MNEEIKISYKVLLLGYECSGKTSILRRYKENTFYSTSLTTIGVDYQTKVFNINNKKILTFQIWDTPGQERFNQMNKSYIKGANGIIIIYDITNKYSLKIAKFWIDTIRNEYKREIPIILVGNKIDLENERVVSTKEGMDFSDDNDLYFCESSAKDDINIENIFNTIFALLDEDFKDYYHIPINSKFKNFRLNNFYSLLSNKYLSK